MACRTAAGGLLEEPAIQADIHIETITDHQSFVDLEPVWNELADASGIDHPFLEHAWVRTWWEAFGAGSTMHLLVVRAGDRPIAIAPLILTPIRMWGIKVRQLGFFYNAHVPCADFLIAEQPEAVYRAIWSYLSRNRFWDLLTLCQLREGSRTLAEMSRLADPDRCRTGVWLSEASPYVPVGASWSEYFDSLAAKHRANLRNRFKRLKVTGPVELEIVTSTEGLAKSLQDGLRLEAAAWKGASQTAIHSDPAVSKFYSILAARAAERGWMRLHFLRAGEARVAFDYSLSYKNRLHLLKVGYDPVYAPYSPSNLLLSMVLQRTFEQALTEYDFLGADADWKLNWATQVRRHYWLFVFPDTLKGRLLHFIKFQMIPLLKRPSLRRVRSFIQRAAARWPQLGVSGGE